MPQPREPSSGSRCEQPRDNNHGNWCCRRRPPQPPNATLQCPTTGRGARRRATRHRKAGSPCQQEPEAENALDALATPNPHTPDPNQMADEQHVCTNAVVEVAGRAALEQETSEQEVCDESNKCCDPLCSANASHSCLGSSEPAQQHVASVQDVPINKEGTRQRPGSALSWYDDGVAVEDIGPPDKAYVEVHTPQVLADIKPHIKETRADPALVSLLEQAKTLSEDCFYEDCLEGCSKRGGWRISLLASGLETGAEAVLLGFIVFKLKTHLHCLSVAKLAVPECFRRRGYGRVLVLAIVQHAKLLNEINCIGLAALPDAVTFYQRLGFKRMHEITAKDAAEDSDLFPGQIYMEFAMRKKRGGGGSRR